MTWLDMVAGACILLATAYVIYMMVRKARKGGCGCGSNSCEKGSAKSVGTTEAGCGCGCGGAGGIQERDSQ